MSAQSNRLQQEWQAFWLAIGFLTRIPMLVKIDYSQHLMNQSSMYFPLVGLLLGALYAALFSVTELFWSPVASVLLVISFHLWITGAFHEDGLADSVDALGGGYTVAKKLEIMKDSRIGTYGTVALIMALGLKAAFLLDTRLTGLALLVAPAISRLTPLLLMGFLPYVTDPDKSKSKPVADGFSLQRLAFASGFVFLVTLIAAIPASGLLFCALLATLAAALGWGFYLKKQLGGYTGDALGASVVLSELVLLAGFSALNPA
ncbi:adenosylcobinamide-GDP ribazoletransferase [Marinobacter salinexigens]|uniref:Adenosylcobinamide-GDP ribazoletransferase n=1 Tax=Marinobacter salinexigens TaxID=2919747 RepID=A0A5B0VIB0_9GAMM|nr:adenosylcobinamide-GDP ribazoletransferase [Marinobacter salinexigens]KAA1174372.1 adenosylcobinamide-GDP ribazoletransferase [Marinobacter salinexigens]